METGIFVLMFWLLWMFVAVALARRRNRSTVGWFLWSFFFGVFPVIVLAVLPNKIPQKKCPFCAAAMPVEAIYCLHCKLFTDNKEMKDGKKES